MHENETFFNIFMVRGLGQVGKIVMRNDDVFSIGHGELLGIQGASSEAKVPIKVAEISGLNIKGKFASSYALIIFAIVMLVNKCRNIHRCLQWI